MKPQTESEEHVTQIIPAIGYEAVYLDKDTKEEFTQPIIAWGIHVWTETFPSGKTSKYSMVKGLVLCEEENALDDASSIQGFMGLRLADATSDITQ